MRHGLPSASGMLFSLVLAASMVQAYGFRRDNQRTLIAGFDFRASCHTFNSYSPRNHFFVEFRARNAGELWPRVHDVGRGHARHEVIRGEIAGLGPAG